MRGGHGDALASYGNLQPSGLAFGLLGQEMQLGGTVWEQRERYIANSPIYQFDRVRTPLLIIHGEKERTVPVFLADQVFASLQRLGQEVEYARYTGENHSESLWAYANQRDYVARLIRWFSSHLQRESSEVTGRASETH
jgi:dipeptidyl aminopeptidase/acylaminoacyl peptidase